MGSQAIDLSAGLTSPPPPSSGGIDLSAGLSGGNAAPTQPTPVETQNNTAPAPRQDVQLPGPVQAVADAGKGYGEGFVKQGKKTLGGVLNILGSVLSDDANAHYATPAIPGLDDLAQSAAKHLKRGADWLNQDTDEHGFWEHAGGFAENIAELMTPEALANLAKPIKAAEGVKALGAGASEARAALPGAVGAAEKFADAHKIASVLQKYPRLASLVGLGMSAAARGSAETGLQTFLKTGGDEQQTLDSAMTGAELGGAAAPLAELGGSLLKKVIPETKTIGGVDVPVSKDPVPSTSARKGAEAYSGTARETAVPHMAGIGMSAQQISDSLNSVHDFTGVADQLTKMNARAYDTLDSLTNGKFRQLNEQIKAAKAAAFDGGEGAATKLQQLHSKMDTLLQEAGGGQLPAAWLQRVKDSWTQSYMLDDIGRVLDRSLDGLPGRTNVSSEQRGINGKTLESGLRRVVEQHGYEAISKVLGPGRIQNLEAIAKATKTNSGRSLINHAVHHAATYLGAAAGAGVAGWVSGGSHAAEAVGAAAGAGVGHATRESISRVVDAIRSNPRIGKAFLHMVQNGTNPSVYGPIISGMITESRTGDAEPK